MSVTAFIALGTNLGNREQHLESAINALQTNPDLQVKLISSIYETEPIGGPPNQNDYLNAVVEVQTDLSARQLMQVLLEIEHQLGRVRKEKNGPRTIDLDLLFHGDEVIREEDLVIPHPRLHLRSFVLEPMAEIAPDKVHPLLGKTMEYLWENYDPETVKVAAPMPAPANARPLDGLRALVTGSTSGIGKAIALAMAGAGADVIVHGRNNKAAKLVADEIEDLGAATGIIIADLGELDECKRMAEAAWSAWNGLDIWVNNAGVDTLTGAAAGWNFLEKLEALLEVDVRAAMLLSRDIGRRMKQTGTGVILNMGWDQAETGMEGDSGQLFSACKGAIMAFSKSLALSLAPEVRVNCLAPGWIQTAWGKDASTTWQKRVHQETPLKRWGVPEDVAATACWLASPQATFITGQTIRINGGVVR